MRYSDLNGLDRTTARFLNGATESTELDLKAAALAGLLLPAGFLGTTLKLKACLTREDSPTNPPVFYPVYDDYGNEIIIPVGPSRIISMKRLLPLGLSRVILVSNAAESVAVTAICQEVYPK